MKTKKRVPLIKQVGINIKNARKARGFAQEGLAERIGRTVSFVEKIESGKINISLRIVVSIAFALRVELYILLEDR